MQVTTIPTTGLGDSSYVFTHERKAVIVDPQRDVTRVLAALDTADEVRFVFETHLHNDYISGGPDLADRVGAELVLPAAAAPAYRSTPAFHMEPLDVGSFIVRPIHTPGHTPEHTSYLIEIDGAPVAVFSGGSLLVASAGRPDLLGDERADSLARLQYRSIHRLAELPDEVSLYPTHGAGSFCTSTLAGRDASTIGLERRTSPVLALPSEQAFVDAQLSGLQPYPSYYAHMGPANLYGAAPASTAPLKELAPTDVDLGAMTVIDVRSKRQYAAAHIPGSIAIEMSDRVGVWAGWVAPHDATIAFVADADDDLEELAAQFRRIGMDDLAGVMIGLDDWVAEGHPTATFRVATPAEFRRAQDAGEVHHIIDVRAPNEFAERTLPGAIGAYVPELLTTLPEGLDDQPVWLVCASGFRAMVASASLERAGLEPAVLIEGGVDEVLGVG